MFTATQSTQTKNIEKYPPKRKVFMELETASRALVLAEGFPLVYTVTRGSHHRFRGWRCKSWCTRSGYLKLWPTRFSCRQYGNGPSDMQGLSKPLVLLAQPVQVIYKGMCTIGSGVGVRNRPLEAMSSSGPHKTVSRQHGNGPSDMQGLSKPLVLLAQPVQVILKSYTEGCAQFHACRHCRFNTIVKSS